MRGRSTFNPNRRCRGRAEARRPAATAARPTPASPLDARVLFALSLSKVSRVGKSGDQKWTDEESCARKRLANARAGAAVLISDQTRSRRADICRRCWHEGSGPIRPLLICARPHRADVYPTASGGGGKGRVSANRRGSPKKGLQGPVRRLSTSKAWREADSVPIAAGSGGVKRRARGRRTH